MSGDLFHIRSASQQLADHLRDQINSGRLRGEMPGVHTLASEYGLHRSTVERSFHLLEQDGVIRSQGPGKRRKIKTPQEVQTPGLRVGLLLSSRDDITRHFINELRHQLILAGHEIVIADKALHDLRFKVDRVSRLVDKTPCDGWVVIAGSREILEWFSEQTHPAFAFLGFPDSLPLAAAGPSKGAAVSELVERLAGLGHRRISMLVDRRLRMPHPIGVIRQFIDDLEAHGIPSSSFNLPDWSGSPESLWNCLESLFRISPPTALIIDESDLVPVVLQFLGQRNLSAPRDISLACLDDNRVLQWMNPRVAHMIIDSGPWIRRLLRWAENVAAGAKDHKKMTNKVRFYEGGTIGPPPTSTAPH